MALVTGITAGSVTDQLASGTSVTRVGGSWYGCTSLDAAAAAVLGHLRAAHHRKRRASAEPLESLRAGLSGRFSAELIDHVVSGLAAAGEVVVDGPGIRLAGHEAGLSEDEERAMRELEQALLEADLAPPSPAELALLIDVSRDVLNDLLRLLVERGQVVRVTPEMFVAQQAEARARATIRSMVSAGAVAPGEFRVALGLTRKHLIPLLEHMDRVGLTRRTPEGRVLKDSG